jgi:amino acid permease
MPLLTILIILIVCGVVLYLVNAFIPMDKRIKLILNIVAIVAIIIWLCHVFGLIHYLSAVHV